MAAPAGYVTPANIRENHPSRPIQAEAGREVRKGKAERTPRETESCVFFSAFSAPLCVLRVQALVMAAPGRSPPARSSRWAVATQGRSYQCFRGSLRSSSGHGHPSREFIAADGRDARSLLRELGAQCSTWLRQTSQLNQRLATLAGPLPDSLASQPARSKALRASPPAFSTALLTAVSSASS